MKFFFCLVLSILNIFSNEITEDKTKCKYSLQGAWISDQKKTLEWYEKLRGTPIPLKQLSGMKKIFGNNLKHFVFQDFIISIYKGRFESSKLNIVAEDRNSIAFLGDSVFEKGESEITLITFESDDEYYIDTEFGIREYFSRVK